MLKNYTSGVPVDRTISRIESLLVTAGASNIVKDYKEGKLDAICFMVVMPDSGDKVSVRLPAKVEAVYATMKDAVKRPRRGTLEKLQDQASRTAWKLMQDWVEVQLSLIQMHQVEFLQVFLPYVWTGKSTFYDMLKGQNFKMLTAHSE